LILFSQKKIQKQGTLGAGTQRKKKTIPCHFADAYNNERKDRIHLQGTRSRAKCQLMAGAPIRATVLYLGNILKIKAPIANPNGVLAKFFCWGTSFEDASSPYSG